MNDRTEYMSNNNTQLQDYENVYKQQNWKLVRWRCRSQKKPALTTVQPKLALVFCASQSWPFNPK